MFDAQALVAGYMEMWNETDDERRRTLVARTVAEDASYLDPMMSAEGVDAISAMIAGTQDQFPGHRFELLEGPDSHHDRVRFTWALAPEAGAQIAVGIDFATVSGDGRMQDITGFLAAS